MAIVTHGDGKNIRIQPAMAIFLIIMACVFLVDAATTGKAVMSLLAIVVGIVWYYVATHFRHWWHH